MGLEWKQQQVAGLSGERRDRLGRLPAPARASTRRTPVRVAA